MGCAQVQIGHCVDCKFYHEVSEDHEQEDTLVDTTCKNVYSEYHGREIDLTDSCSGFKFKGRFNG